MSGTATATKPAASTTTPPTDSELYTKAMEAAQAAVAAVQALRSSPTIDANSIASVAAAEALDLAKRVGGALTGAALNIAAYAAASGADDMLAPEVEEAHPTVVGASASSAAHDSPSGASHGSDSPHGAADTHGSSSRSSSTSKP